MSKDKKTQSSWVDKLVDPHTLKMRVDVIDTVLNMDNNRQYAMNRPAVKAMLGMADGAHPKDQDHATIVAKLTEGAYNGYDGLGFSSLITGHKALAKALTSADGKPKMVIPVGVGVIGHCTTHAAGGRNNLSARYSQFRGNLEASENEEYDEQYDKEPFADYGGHQLLIPVFYWHTQTVKGKEIRRPRFNLVCSGCFEMYLANRDSYMNKVRIMASPIPRRLPDGKVDTNSHKVDKISNKIHTGVSSASNQKATQLTAKRILKLQEITGLTELNEYIVRGNKTKRHKNGKTQIIPTLDLNGDSTFVTLGVEYLLTAHGLPSWQQILANNSVDDVVKGGEEE